MEGKAVYLGTEAVYMKHLVNDSGNKANIKTQARIPILSPVSPINCPVLAVGRFMEQHICLGRFTTGPQRLNGKKCMLQRGAQLIVAGTREKLLSNIPIKTFSAHVTRLCPI